MLDSVDYNGTSNASENRVFELDGYSDIRQIGTGGMAIVYSATQNTFQRKVAIKVLLPAYASDAEFAQRFLREAQIVSGLSHPHIIPVYDFGQRDGTFYIVMEYMAGGDLATWIKRGFEEEEALSVLNNISSALHFLHEKGVVHRDVKPDNVMFREDNSAVLTDFGIARKQNAASQMTVAGQILGTPKYMSPEQLQGRELDGRSDIYSLGIMFYEMLCKKPPYEDEDFIRLATMHIQAPLPKLPTKFSKYQKFLERMIAKQPEHRFRTALEIVKIIQQIRSGQHDAANVDSGNAASLKQAMEVNEGELANAESQAAPVKLSRTAMIELNDMDPLLNPDWSNIVSTVFSKMGAAEKKFIYAQILKPKGILFDSQKKQFVFYGRKSVADTLQEGVTSSALQVIGKKLLEMEKTLRATTNLKTFADLLEASIAIIDSFNADDNLAVQKEKNLLRAAYIDDMITIIRNAQFDLPENRRSLSVDGIRAYMLDVYIKQQMIGYRYKTLSLSQLERDPNEFLRTVVAREARTRQCDIVRTDTHIYLIGPVRDAGQNAFSIRRFLHEDSSAGGQVVYFNAIAIPLDKVDIPKAQETIQWLMSRIVTLERQLSEGVYNFVASLEQTREQYLNPMLQKAIEADGSSIEGAIEARLNDFEKKISLLMLSKIPGALSDLAKTLDEYEYLFFNIRRLLIEMACDVRDFAAQSAVSLSAKAEELDLKMMSYIRLIDKCKSALFSVSGPKDDDPSLDNSLLMEEIKTCLEQHEAEIAALHVKLRETIKKMEVEKTALQKFMIKIFGEPKKKELTPDEIQGQISAARRRCLLTIIRIVKRYPKITVYLELEDIMTVNESVRHYGLACGRQGITKLPFIIALHEDSEQMDIPGMRQLLKDAA